MKTNKKNALTPREIKIIKMISQELTNREIAEKLELSPRTIEWNRENIMDKTKAKSAIGLFKYAVKNEIVKFKVS